MSLMTYLNLDLAHSSPAAADLFARAEREGSRGAINLTGDGDDGAASANLTPEMSAWLGAHVGHRRAAALSAIEGAARNIRDRGNAPGIIAEVEEDRLKRACASRRADVTREFYDHHRSDIDAMNQLRDEYDRQRVDEGNRDAKVPSPLLDYSLPLLVAVPEGFMNFGSFVALSGLGIAGLGLTAVVGAGIGLAAWLAGRFWKAYHFYMRADDDEQQQRGWRMLWIASSLLSVSLTVVGYARFRTVAEKAEREVLLGIDPSNPVTATALLLTGNLLVFFVGATITYIIHDENPLFADRAHKLAGAAEKFDKQKKQELDDKVAEIERRYRQDREKMLKRAGLMTSNPAFAPVSEDIGRLSAKDHEVIGLLTTYRNRLVDVIEPRNPDFRFSASAAERQTGTVSGTIGLSEFTVQPLHLYRGAK